jgi:hypothetical protein
MTIPTESTDWKSKHANDAESAIDSPFVIRAMEEFALNMGFDFDGFQRYGLMKIASIAAQVARAEALGFDPELLRLTPTEANSQILLQAASAVFSGVPVHLVEAPTKENTE